jgi:hypothetical protein
MKWSSNILYTEHMYRSSLQINLSEKMGLIENLKIKFMVTKEMLIKYEL